MYLHETGGGTSRQTEVILRVDANDGGGLQLVGSTELNLTYSGTPTLRTLSLTNGSDLTLEVGSTFQLEINNNVAQNNRVLVLSQVNTAPFSEIVMPLTGSVEVSELKFYDLSGTDAGGCTPNCGTEVNPAYVETGATIWARAIISDAFGSFDVNTGCDGVTSTNCPTITITDPLSADKTPVSPADELTFLQAPDTSSRQYEIEVTPGGFGLEGVWQVEVLGTEGVEGVIFDSAVATFERYGPPILTIIKTVSGTTSPGQVVTYNNDVNNTGTGIAKSVFLENALGDFLELELVESSGSWTALLSLTPGYTINIEEFDSGNNAFDYVPTAGPCGPAVPGPACYDPAIVKWRIELNESIPVNGNVVQEYRALIQ